MRESLPPEALPDQAWGRITRLELRVCRLLNAVESRLLLQLFSTVSWLGNGPFWIALALVMCLAEGRAALPALLHLSIVAAVCFSLYKVLKNRTARPRPFAAEAGLRLTVDPLDEFSFPSGHTLYAVAFTLVLAAHYPLVFWFVLPFTLLVAMSRVVLGLHYPSDVLMGAVLGAVVALTVLWLA